MAHYAAGVTGICEIHKVAHSEKEQIVGRNDQDVVIDGKLFHSEKQVADCPEPRLIGLGAVIYYGYGTTVAAALRPLAEYGGETVVCNDNMPINGFNAVNVVQKTSQDSIVSDFQQGLRKIARQFPQTGGITGGDDYVFHKRQIALLI